MSVNKYSNLPDIVCIYSPVIRHELTPSTSQDSSGKDVYETEDAFQSIRDEVCIF
jgi:hypothetical protein